MDFVEEDLSRKLPAERAHQPYAAGDQLRRHPRAAAAAADRMGDAADRDQARPTPDAQHRRCRSRRWRRAVRPARFCGGKAAGHGMSSPPAGELVEKLPGRQTVLVTGATGFIGSRLVAALGEAGHQVIALVRNPAKADMLRAADHADHQPRSIGCRRRTSMPSSISRASRSATAFGPKQKRRRILDSRIDMTADVVAPDRAAGAEAGGAGLGLGDRLVWPVAGPGADGIGQVACLLQP